MKIKLILKKILFICGKFVPVISYLYKGRYDIVFIFPSNDLSGATRVHLDVVSLFRGKKILTIFTGINSRAGLLNEFRSVSPVFAPGRKKIKSFYLGGITSFIKETRPNYLFGMGTPDFYTVVKSINTNQIRIVDINHAVSSLKYTPDFLIDKIYRRIVIDELTMQCMIDLHESLAKSIENICLIHNKTVIPVTLLKKDNSKLKILYVGRSTYEKRVHLLPLIAKKLKGQIEFELNLIGDFDTQFINEVAGICNPIGVINDKELLNRYYLESDVLLLVSSREGLPMVVIEAMAHGTVSVCTPVGGIPYHIKTGSNGYLIEGNDESEIVENAAKILVSLFNNRELLKTLSMNAYNYSKENFNERKFSVSYYDLLKL